MPFAPHVVESGREQRLPGSVVVSLSCPPRLESKFVELPLGVVGSWELGPSFCFVRNKIGIR